MPKPMSRVFKPLEAICSHSDGHKSFPKTSLFDIQIPQSLRVLDAYEYLFTPKTATIPTIIDSALPNTLVSIIASLIYLVPEDKIPLSTTATNSQS